MIYMERRFSQVFVHLGPGTQAPCGCAHCNRWAQSLTLWVSLSRCMTTERQGEISASPNTHTHTPVPSNMCSVSIMCKISGTGLSLGHVWSLNLLMKSSLVPTSSFRPEGFSYNNRSQNSCSHLETPKHMRSPETSSTLQFNRIC